VANSFIGIRSIISDLCKGSEPRMLSPLVSQLASKDECLIKKFFSTHVIPKKAVGPPDVSKNSGLTANVAYLSC